MSQITCRSHDTCCSRRGQRGKKGVDGGLKRKNLRSIITTCHLPRHMGYQWVVYCLQRFKGHKRALKLALKAAKQHHSEAKGTLEGQYCKQPHETKHEKHSKQFVGDKNLHIAKNKSCGFCCVSSMYSSSSL